MKNSVNETLEKLKASLGREDNTKPLVYLSVDVLHPHKNNPRTNLGDLEELANSIKAKGILQNLTVVPNEEGEYTIIIGHRRHAAAKLAGLKFVPCVVVTMTHQEQLSTMLLENIQRSDLTPFEQAKGFQLMIDIGETVESISEKTGFSNSTIRRRLKMAELDEATLKSVSKRQLSLGDFDRLSKIEDVEARNSVLAHIGTNNFENKLNAAVKEQETKEMKEKIECALRDNGVQKISDSETDMRNYTWVSTLDPGNYEKVLGDLKSGVAYFYDSSWGATFRLYKAASTEKTAEELEREEAIKASQTRRAQIDDLFARTYSLRKNFILNFNHSDAKKVLPAVIEYLIKLNWLDLSPHSYYQKGLFNQAIGIDEDTSKSATSFDLVARKIAENYEYALLVETYCTFGDGAFRRCIDHKCCFAESPFLNTLYEFLAKIGYDISDEEKEMLVGNHPLFVSAE